MPPPLGTELDRDPVAQRVVAFLEAEGVTPHRHGFGRSLRDHLVGTYEILRRWEQPPWLAHAGLIHSIYGTESHPEQLVAPGRSREVRGLVGEAAEGLAHLFAVTPRRLLAAGARRWAHELRAPAHDGDPPATQDERDALVMLHLANLAEQARAPDGSPGPWLVIFRELAELLYDSETIALPLFVATLSGLSAGDESAARAAYREGVAADDPAVRVDRLALAAAACPVAGEPCLWLAHAAAIRGETQAVRAWAENGRRRLTALGTAWDKRLAFEEWLELAGSLITAPPGDGAVSEPRGLLGAVRADRGPRPVVSHDGDARFLRYVDRLADAPRPSARVLYPDLPSRPWHGPAGCPLAAELEANADAIREEVLALDPDQFVPESERIARRGEWDVVFLYERGRRHDDVCAACPVTTRIIEGASAMRTPGGLIYVSRMQPDTHIHSHRGPTNLRLRCHLGIVVPDGDCAIRVGEETRPWAEGRCLVFDDSFEHEAWNHTEQDRIVLIVDLWHPGLSAAEIRRLAALQRHSAAYARRLERYWAVNDAARVS